eukprot:gnl/MRDRNA2_/MRDRNA2_80860_c0_seq1.p1 gnl/MRDRNA2_/MRDRNA2_80860_c0~~gnl/MRDRNA2_/MRDRNA2_80860_c0_seq1.p1  ORF type:complete len:286 (+),score=44.13 gnl/MRDRNA2_/MRDRNA2_80860_c0_seq1:86-943(+)
MSSDTDLTILNEAFQQKHQAGVLCKRTSEKGRILLASCSFKQGDAIFCEETLHSISPQHGNCMYDKLCQVCIEHADVFELEPIWYFSALCSLTAAELVYKYRCRCEHLLATPDVQKKLLMLYRPEPQMVHSNAFTILAELFAERNTVTGAHLYTLMDVWSFNSFACRKSGGLELFWLAPMMSHSCCPSAFITTDTKGVTHVCALHDIEVGQEISISYLSQSDLKRSSSERRRLLQDSKEFLCNCDRCRMEGVKGRKSRLRRLRRKEMKTLAQEFEMASAKQLALG